MENNTAIVKQDQPAPLNKLKTVFDFKNTASLEITQRYIRMLSDANSVPKKFRNKVTGAVNYGDLLLVFDVMVNTGNNLAMCLNGLNPINGLLSAGAEWKKTQLDRADRFYDDDWVEVGKRDTDSWGYYYQGIRKRDNHKCVGPTITVKMAKDAGWWNREHSLWPKDTQNMLRKRALSRFVNDYAPDVSLNSVMDEDNKFEFIDVEPVQERKGLFAADTPSDTPPPLPPNNVELLPVAEIKEEPAPIAKRVKVKLNPATDKILTKDVTLYDKKAVEVADDYAQQDLDNQIGVALSELGSKLSTSQVRALCEKNGVKYEVGLLDNGFLGLKTVLGYANR